ncbi:MAG: hypothetical protein JXB00_03555 [Bacteroidales bacterium]|nr:hypothetical protein [Bacteroidales bacterium]
MRSSFILKIFISGLLFFAPAVMAHSQDCTDYHQYHCAYADYTFFYSRQSKSFLFRKGQTAEVQIVAYAGEEYYLSVCGARKLGTIRFRIISDDNDRTVLFDNAENEYQSSVSFVNEATSNLIIELSTAEGSSKESKDTGCLGLVVQFKKVQ